MLFGKTRISVGDRDLHDVAVVLARGATVSGRVEFESGSTTPVPPGQIRATISLRPLDGSPWASRVLPLPEDRTFRTQGQVPGRYLLWANVSAPGWIPRSAMYGGRNLLLAPIDLGTNDLENVVITMTDKAAEISGTVALPAGDVEAAVMLAPANYQALAADGMMALGIRSAPIRDGAFRMTGVLPGEYVILAASRSRMPANPDLESMVGLLRQGTRITLGDRERRSIALTVVGGR
jgi:hypothetical protein